jgi:pimeloyl-ACP methyl ester carboxylesterase
MVDVSEVIVGEGHLSVLEAGRGGRPLLLVHGFTGAKEDFGDWIDHFAAQGWWVVAPDLRGHGASHQPPGEDAYSLALFAGEVEALVDTLGWERFALLGHSMGGMIAQALAIDVPERITRLVLMDTHHGPIEGLDPEVVAIGMDVLRTQGLPTFLELLDSMPAERAPSDERVRATRPGYVEWNERKLRTSSPAMYAAMATELVNRPDRLAEVAAVAVPTRVVVGAEDTAFVAAAHRLADAIEGADLVVIPDAAHSPQFENPDAWWEAVSTFLAAG